MTRERPPTQREPADLPDGDLSSTATHERWTLPTIAPDPETVAYIRRQTKLTLRLWQLGNLVGPVEILISELATNVVRHARTLFTVTLSWDGRTLRGEVNDGDPMAPRPQLTTSLDREGGRGLLLVDVIAADWGVALYPQSKTVWFEISRDP